MVRQEFLDYVWKYCIEPQLGYSFSLNHTLPYSLIAVQEMNLATRWNPLYWQCACLCVNAGNYVGDMGDNDDDEEVEEEETETDEEETPEDGTTVKHVAPNYGKIAKAISDAQLSGVNIELPDINNADKDFIPDIKNNSIFYSMQAVNVVNDDLLNRILSNRPYASMLDFFNKVSPTTVQMLGLIKAGCFDELERKSRRMIMHAFLKHIAEDKFPLKDKLTSVQVRKAIELGFQSETYKNELRIFKFKRYIDAHCFNATEKRYVLSDETCRKFFHTFFAPDMNLSKGDYALIASLDGDKIAIKKTAFTKVYDKKVEPLMAFFNSDDGKLAYQNILHNDMIEEYMNKYGTGSVADWEMETMCFYHEPHPMSSVNNAAYDIRSFKDLPETGGPSCAVAGTVTNADNTRHIVSILTTTGVVDVKFYGQAYSRWNQKISVVDDTTKKKTVIDDTWFKRGTKLILYGTRAENMFRCRSIKVGSFTRSVGLIEGINSDGSLTVRYTRKKAK